MHDVVVLLGGRLRAAGFKTKLVIPDDENPRDAYQDGVYRGFSTTPIYWLTGQYSRYVRPGFVRVNASPASGTVLTSAYKGPNRVIVVATNPSESAQAVRITVTGGTVKGSIRPVRSCASEQARSLAPLQPRKGSFSATLAPKSVTTFIALR